MKKELIYQKQYKIALFEFFRESTSFIAMLISAFLANSLLVWLDVIDRAINTANTGFVTVISRRLTKNLKYTYNYGVEKLEALSAILICSFELFSVIIVFILSVTKIITPEQPSELLLLPILIKVLNMYGDITVLVKQKRLKKHASTKIIQSEYASSVKNLMFGSVTFVSMFICWLFRNYRIMWYFSPVMSILIVVYIIYHSIMCIKKAIPELTEKTLPEEEQLKILKCLSEFYSEYTELVSVDSLVRGNTYYIELRLKFAADMTFEQIEDFEKRFSDRLKEKMNNSKVKIVI